MVSVKLPPCGGVVIFYVMPELHTKTKLNELLEFLTSFTYKVMGQALPELAGSGVMKWYSAMRLVITSTVKTEQQRQLPLGLYHH